MSLTDTNGHQKDLWGFWFMPQHTFQKFRILFCSCKYSKESKSRTPCNVPGSPLLDESIELYINRSCGMSLHAEMWHHISVKNLTSLCRYVISSNLMISAGLAKPSISNMQVTSAECWQNVDTNSFMFNIFQLWLNPPHTRPLRSCNSQI